MPQNETQQDEPGQNEPKQDEPLRDEPLPGGEALAPVAFTAHGMAAEALAQGATLSDLLVPAGGGLRRVVLGFADRRHYRPNPAHVGATAGRYANRIGGARFTLDGQTHALPVNDGGRNTLHGGPQGFGQQPWQLAARSTGAVTFRRLSPAGEAGFPGALTATCTYALPEPGVLRVTLTATADAPTVVNLAHHSYFTLLPGSSVRGYDLQVRAARFTPVDDALIPTGEIAPVAGTPFDFRTFRRLDHWGDGTFAYDINFVLDRAGPGLAHAATVRSAAAGLALEVWTTEPGLQVYDAKYLGPEPVCRDGFRPFPHAAICLEAQRFPDSPNKPGFPSAVLRPGAEYRQVTEYRFRPFSG